MSRLERSDRSGAPLEPDKPVTVSYLFEDGERRRVKVTAAEAAELLGQGDDTTSRWARAVRTAWRWVKPPGKWLIIAVAGGFVGAQISDYYADRTSELDLEASLVKEISAGAVTLFQTAQEASRATSSPTQIEQRDRAADDWVLDAGRITPVFRTYYGTSGVSAHWDQYQSAMYDWGVLGCCTTDDGRGELIVRIRD